MTATLLEREEIEERAAEQQPLRLTMAQLLFILILAVAAILRFGLLGIRPLDAEEARQALAVWQHWQPQAAPAPGFSASPAYFTFTAPLFALLGASDAMARLAPAIFGVLTVALPWLWRSSLGQGGALAVSALLAVSPSLNMVSAAAGGDAFAVFAALLLFFVCLRYRDDGRRYWLIATAAALGLGLASAPLFYSLAASLSLSFLVYQRFRPAMAAYGADGASGPRTAGARLFLAVALAIFLAGSTFFFTRPAGLGGAAALPAQWLGHFALTAGFPALALPFLALARYELVALTLGAGAVVWAAWRGDPLPQLLVAWFAAGVLLMLLQQGERANMIVLVLPAYLLIGLWLNHALQQAAGDTRWWLAISIALLGVAVYFNGARYLRVMRVSPQQVGYLLLAFIALAAIVVAINFVRSFDKGAAQQGALAGIIVLFVIFNWGTARWMVTDGGSDPREVWVQNGADDDLRMLAHLLRQVSWQSGASANRLELLSAVDAPQLRWYLRDFPFAVFGHSVPPGASHHAIITPDSVDPLAPGDNYLGADFVLQWTLPAEWAGRPLSVDDNLRWWIFHEHPVTAAADRIVLWVRSDILE